MTFWFYIRYLIPLFTVVYLSTILGLYIYYKRVPYEESPVDPDAVIGLLFFLHFFILCFIYADEKVRDGRPFVRQVDAS